jgi:hypothetical protein
MVSFSMLTRSRSLAVVAFLAISGCVASGDTLSDADKSADVTGHATPSCGLAIVDDVGPFGARNPQLLSPNDGDKVRVVVRIYRMDGRYYTKWPCPDMPGNVAEILSTRDRCVPEDKSVVVVEGLAKVPTYEAGTYVADGPRFDLIDGKFLALVRDTALCHGPSKP